MSSSIREQLYRVKRKLRQDRKVRISLPAEFTFNRAGAKYFENVLSFFLWELRDCPVEIDFAGCRSANYQAASLLIPYCWKLKQQGCTISFNLPEGHELNGSRVWKLMGAPGLFAVTTDPTTNFKFSEHKPLFAVRNSEDFQKALVEVDTFTETFGIEYQRTLRYVLSELLYNTLEHGRSDFFWQGKRFPTPSILQFTWYEKINEIHLVVADTGIGVKSHLEQAYPGLASDEEALRLAIQPQVSGAFASQDPYSNRNNAGMGLYLSSNIVRRLRADMYLLSGNGVLHVSPVDVTSKQMDVTWPGTFVLVTVRVDQANAFALDTIMQEFRDQARKEVNSRKTASDESRFYLSIYNYFGRYADSKSAAIKYRDQYLIPAVTEGKSLTVDFNNVESSTHSFLNALLASPIRRMGILAYKRIRIVNAGPDIRQTIDYVLDDNTSDGASPEKYDC